MSRDDFKHSHPMRTVCEVTREIMDIIDAERAKIGWGIYSEIAARLNEQMRMQKKMDAKLRKYAADWDADMWQANPDHAEDEARRNQ